MFASQGTTIQHAGAVFRDSSHTHVTGRASASLLALSFLVQISLSSILVLAPVLLLLIASPVSRLASPQPLTALGAQFRKIGPLLAEFIVYFAAFTFVSSLVAGNWTWIPQTWGATFVASILALVHIVLISFLLQFDPSGSDAQHRAMVVLLH